MRGRQEDTEFFHKTFPFFIWLLRDVTQSIPPDCKDIKEYFLTRVRDNFSLRQSEFSCCLVIHNLRRGWAMMILRGGHSFPTMI